MKLVDILCLTGIAAIVLSVIGYVCFQPYMEARTYNKLTGNNVSTWDAMWVELRVQDTPQRNN